LGGAFGTAAGVATCGGDWGCVGRSGLAGAAGGALAPLGGAGLGGALLGGVLSSAGSGAAGQFMAGRFDADALRRDALVGAGTGAAFHALGGLRGSLRGRGGAGPNTAVADLADSYPRPPGVGDARTVAVLDTPSGRSYPGRNGFPGQPHPSVQEALDAVPSGVRPPFHGQCAEIHCITQALDAGDDVAGGTIATARVRGPNSPAHGTSIPPCPSCQLVLDKFGVHS
jgi:hypothetical protein